MAQVQITGHVYEQHYSWETESVFIVSCIACMSDENRTYVGPVQITYEIPDGYNPTAQKLAALAKKREAACKEFADTVRAIDEQISKLQAIEFDGVAA